MMTDDTTHPGLSGLEAYLLDEPDGVELRKLWAAHGAEVLAAWVAKQPGTRPSCWWRFEAPRWQSAEAMGRDLPVPRLRVGGKGRVAPGTAWEKALPKWFAGNLDPTDPPRFEAEAAYLRRLGLLLPREAARLRAADFEPMAIGVAIE